MQPETEDEPVVIGTAQGTDAMDAYRNLLAENPQLAERKFEKVFCYQVDGLVKEKGATKQSPRSRVHSFDAVSTQQAQNSMKRTNKKKSDEMRPAYDFSQA